MPTNYSHVGYPYLLRARWFNDHPCDITLKPSLIGEPQMDDGEQKSTLTVTQVRYELNCYKCT